jgi:hypothetical protein
MRQRRTTAGGGHHIDRDLAIRDRSGDGDNSAGRQDESGHRRAKPSHARSVLPESVHQGAVDDSGAARSCLMPCVEAGAFEVRMVHLATGDYLIDDQVLIDRKTIGDLRASLVDGRFFAQVARLCSQELSIASLDGRPDTNGGLSYSSRVSSVMEGLQLIRIAGSMLPWNCSDVCSEGRPPTRRRKASGVAMNRTACS